MTPERVSEVEAQLGFRLPEAYLDVLRERNGGELVNDCSPTDFRSSWGGVGGQQPDGPCWPRSVAPVVACVDPPGPGRGP